MPHVPVDPHQPGILGLLQFRPETAKPLMELTEVLLRGPSSLSRADRELIAGHVSQGNECEFCSSAHFAVATAHLGDGGAVVEQMRTRNGDDGISRKLRMLLAIADKVRVDGRNVSADDVADARAEGATDEEIHDTVLIAAAFCMFNRYVDGLATGAPNDAGFYTSLGSLIAGHGYRAAAPATATS